MNDRKTLLAKLEFERMSPRTRSVLFQRLETVYPSRPQILTDEELDTATGLAETLIPQKDQPDWHIDLARDLDQRLTETLGKGWRYDNLPDEVTMYRQGLELVDSLAKANFNRPLIECSEPERETVIKELQSLTEPAWAARFFEELLTGFAETYYSSPLAQSSIGCTSMVDIQK